MMIASDNVIRPAFNNDQLNRFAPAIFATQPVAEASARYSFIPTIAVIDGLRDAGWYPVAASQNKSRNADWRASQHMVRFRNEAMEPIVMPNGNRVFPEVIMTNSHDLSSAFKFLIGAFVAFCTNGLVTGDQFGSISVRHNTKAIDEAIAGCFGLLDNVEPMMSEINRFRQIELKPEHRNVFARSALNFKHGVHSQQVGEKPLVVYGDPRKHRELEYEHRNDEQVVHYVPITPEQILKPRRYEDNGTNLWDTYNVIQENLIQGGIRGRTAGWRRTSTNSVKAIDTDVKLNKAL